MAIKKNEAYLYGLAWKALESEKKINNKIQYKIKVKDTNKNPHTHTHKCIFL